MSDFYDFLNTILCKSNVIKKESSNVFIFRLCMLDFLKWIIRLVCYSGVMNAIQCTHPPHHHNGFEATCWLWLASGGVQALSVWYMNIYISYIHIYIYIYIYIHTNLPVNAIVRLPHPWSGDSQGQDIYIYICVCYNCFFVLVEHSCVSWTNLCFYASYLVLFEHSVGSNTNHAWTSPLVIHSRHVATKPLWWWGWWVHWIVFMTSLLMYYAPCFVLVEHSVRHEPISVFN